MGLKSEIEKAVNWNAPGVELNDSLRAVIKTMVDNCVSALVVRSGGEIVGLVTDMDIMDRIVAGDDLDGVKVSGFMTKCDLITEKGAASPCAQLDSEQTIEGALRVMNSANTHHLLVTGPDAKAGMVSICDLFKQVIS